MVIVSPSQEVNCTPTVIDSMAWAHWSRTAIMIALTEGLKKDVTMDLEHIINGDRAKLFGTLGTLLMLSAHCRFYKHHHNLMDVQT